MAGENKTSGAAITESKSSLTVSRGEAAAGWKKWLLDKLLHYTGNPPIRIQLWDGTSSSAPAQKCVATMHIRNKKWLPKLVMNPDLHFGEAYMAGDIVIEGDLVQFLEAVYVSRAHSTTSSPIERWSYQWQKWTQNNSLAGSRRNIHHHYDLGNEFYRLWLDQAAMQYTCAYFPSTTATLEEAQLAKLEHVCRKLRLQPGQTVVEAGCGWGGLARYMARQYQVKVRAYNISREQVAFAREKAREEGLDHLVEYVLDDYRNICGQYDAFVSVGMLEHVGVEHFRELGRIMRNSLKPEGMGLIHSIGRNYPAPMNAWIERRIFPNANPPSLGEMMHLFEPSNLSVLDVENLRLHYAETLRHWLRRFDGHQAQIQDMFDADFIRAWRLYLAGSIAAFTTGQLQLFQVVFSHGESNRVPRTRHHLYNGTRAESDFHG